MIRSLGVHKQNPVNPKIMYHKPREIFRCIHHNRDTGLCEIYEMRPSVCRLYASCEHQNLLEKESENQALEKESED